MQASPDVKALRQSNIKRAETGYALDFRQVKTGAPELLPLSAQAVSILEQQLSRSATASAASGGSDLIFRLPAQQTLDKAVRRWVSRAGIQKKISFHCARHTFATLSLKHGVDVYTLSKLLGHRHIGTTEIYAKVVDETKKQAVRLLPTLRTNAHV